MIKSLLMKRHVISYLFDISIFSSMPVSFTDERPVGKTRIVFFFFRVSLGLYYDH